MRVDTGSWPAGTDAIVWQIRLPRVLLAGMVGASLACAGATYQGVFRNPLAEPYLIGVAAGAGLGAAIAIVSPFGGSWHGLSAVPLFAFVGAIAAVAVAYGTAHSAGATPTTTLILAGVAISTLASAAMSFIFLQHNEKFLTILAWLLGGFNTASWTGCLLVLPYLVLMSVLVLGFGRALNVLQLGEEQAQQLGLRVERLKLLLLLAASLGAAAAVAAGGLISFVGLIVPHVLRLLWGPDYRRLLPLSLPAGALFLILADGASRTILRPQEVPIGVITALCGAPFFLFLLRQSGRVPA
jgi:iron complex transport system permease protein